MQDVNQTLENVRILNIIVSYLLFSSIPVLYSTLVVFSISCPQFDNKTSVSKIWQIYRETSVL